MTDRLRSLARQAVALIDLGHDRVDAIHRMLVVASGNVIPTPIATLPPAMRAAALVIMGAPGCTTTHIALECGCSKMAAVERCRVLRKRGIVVTCGHGRNRLATCPKEQAPPDPYEQLVQWGRFREISPTTVMAKQKCGMTTACSRLGILVRRGIMVRLGRGRYKTRSPATHRALTGSQPGDALV